MIHFIRVLFLMLVSAVSFTYLARTGETTLTSLLIMIGGVVSAFAIISFDLVVPRKNLSTLSGLLFGVLVGVVISYALGFLIEQVLTVFLVRSVRDANQALIEGGKLLLGLMITYITVSLILQTKDDFRFIIPYVEFARATKGPKPLLLDTSVIIDGRIADLAASGIFESCMLVPRFVLNELQAIADSGDRLKRSRGRRGLEVLQRLQANPKLELRIWDGSLTSLPETEGVDQKLVALAQQESGRVVTNDANLQKIAQLRGVEVININMIADAVKPVALPGEPMHVRIVKAGEGPNQGVGYLEDGTMVVVENARDKVGHEIDIVVTNTIQTPAGKMIFGRTEPVGAAAKPARVPTA